jgi:hypothetical protein
MDVNIKVLFLTASLVGIQSLALDEEVRAIDARIRGAEYRDRLELKPHFAVRLDDISGMLMREGPHIVHFSGHGAHTGGSLLLDQVRTLKPVLPAALAGLSRLLKDNILDVVLNACYSEFQAEAIVQHVDCAVGMNEAHRRRGRDRLCHRSLSGLGLRLVCPRCHRPRVCPVDARGSQRRRGLGENPITIIDVDTGGRRRSDARCLSSLPTPTPCRPFESG